MGAWTIGCTWPGCPAPGGPIDLTPVGQRLTTGMSFASRLPGRITNLHAFKWNCEWTSFGDVQLWDEWGNLLTVGNNSMAGQCNWCSGFIDYRINPGQQYVVAFVIHSSYIWGHYSENPGSFGVWDNGVLWAWAGRYAYHGGTSRAFPHNITSSWYAQDIYFENWPPEWITGATAVGTRGVFFSQSFAASNMGGVFSPSSYVGTAGALPPGLTLNAATGIIAGTPTQPGIYDFYMEARSADGAIGRWTQFNIGPRGRLDNFAMTGLVRH